VPAACRCKHFQDAWNLFGLCLIGHRSCSSAFLKKQGENVITLCEPRLCKHIAWGAAYLVKLLVLLARVEQYLAQPLDGPRGLCHAQKDHPRCFDEAPQHSCNCGASWCACTICEAVCACVCARMRACVYVCVHVHTHLCEALKQGAEMA